MFCPKCGAENLETMKFCLQCGAALPQAKELKSASSERPGRATPHEAAGMRADSHTARPRGKSKAPLVVGGIVVVAIIAVAAFALTFVLGGATPRSLDEQTNAATLAGTLASSDGYDYFYSAAEEAICRAKPGEDVERLVSVPNDDSMGYAQPAFNVLSIAADGTDVFYVIADYEDGMSGVQYELRCVNSDGSNDRSLIELVPDSEGTYLTPGALYAYDGRAYLSVRESSAYETGRTKIVSIDAAGEDERVECTIDADYLQVIIRPDVLYCTKQEPGYTSDDPGYAVVYKMSIDGSSTQRLYETESARIDDVAIMGDSLVLRETDLVTSASRIVAVDGETGTARTLYRPAEGKAASILATSDDLVYLECHDPSVPDGATWDLIAITPHDEDAEASTVASRLAYYNPRAAVANGHLLVCQNGGDYGSVGVRVAAVSLEDGSVIEEFVS